MVVFVFVEFNGGSAKAVAMTLVVLLACFVLFAVFLSLFPYFSLPAGLMPVSSSSSSFCFVRAAVVCCLFLFSTYVFCLYRLSSSSSSSSCCFVRAAVICSRIYAVLAAFLIFLHHILQNSCRLFLVFLVLIFIIFPGRACFVVFSHQVR